jgi:5-formyltetrahydrofolate cyclo-ligase
MADDKTYLRQVLSESRAALSVSRRDGFSREISAGLLRTKFYQDSPAVVLYAAIDNEVRTDQIFADALASRRKVYFPRVVADRRSLAIVEVCDPSALRPGAFGIPEPSGGEEIEPARLGQTVVCVPAVAFSVSGQRLGRGGGSYDRFIAQLSSETITVGLAYSFQLLDTLPENASDRRVQFIVTESGVRAVRGTASAAGYRTDRGGTVTCFKSS